MLHKKSPAPITGNEALPSRKNHTRNDSPIKRIKKRIKKRLPPNGQFYLDAINGTSKFPDEQTVLIYVGIDKPWEYAKHAKEIGLAPPIVVDQYLQPKAYHWPVNGLKVRVICMVHMSEDFQDQFAMVLHEAGATEIQYCPFFGVAPLYNPPTKVVSYE